MKTARSNIIKRTLAVPLAASLLIAPLACFSSDPDRNAKARQAARAPEEAPKPIVNSPPLPAGTYDVQSVQYDDATGAYKVFVLNAPQGHKPVWESQEVKMARLDDAAIQAGKKTYLESKDGETALYLTPDFQIAYVHNVTEERANPAGQRETVVVRQESTMWSPFMSAMAGVAIGNMLFAPRYYYPPPYAGGGTLTGFGGAGASRELANADHRARFGQDPKSARLSKSGMAPRRMTGNSLRSSGSGAGSSRFKPSPTPSRPRGRGFGFGRRR